MAGCACWKRRCCMRHVACTILFLTWIFLRVYGKLEDAIGNANSVERLFYRSIIPRSLDLVERCKAFLCRMSMWCGSLMDSCTMLRCFTTEIVFCYCTLNHHLSLSSPSKANPRSLTLSPLLLTCGHSRYKTNTSTSSLPSNKE